MNRRKCKIQNVRLIENLNEGRNKRKLFSMIRGYHLLFEKKNWKVLVVFSKKN